MELFHDFTAPLWELFAGNLLFLLCSLCYLAWWAIAFRPGATAGGAASAVCLTAACIAGLSAVGLLAHAVGGMAPHSRGIPVRYVLLGAAVSYAVLLLVTVTFFRRPVTSELLIMHIWAALELAVTAVLAGTGRFSSGGAAALAALVGAATVAGLICYVAYYHLDGAAGYRAGMVPLVTDAAVTAIFLAAQALA